MGLFFVCTDDVRYYGCFFWTRDYIEISPAYGVP
jgi:hypothetical protein